MRFIVPDDKKLTYELVIPIRWGDMDMMGHVNNALYFRYMETIRLEWMGKIGAQANPHGDGPVIVNAFCNFIRQLEYPGEVMARHYVSHPGRTSFDSYITLGRTDDPGVIYAEGGSKVVWVDFQAQKSKPLPDWLRALVDPAVSQG